ncbi:MAG TPA: hypothetical protein VGC24_05515 [Burkholderiaceae bacterium]
MNRIVIIALALLLWTAAAFLAGREWRDRSADIAAAASETHAAVAAADAQAQARTTEKIQATATQAAAYSAAARKDKIDADYDARIAAAVAGRDADIGRLRQQWAGCETSRLSDPAAAAAAAAEEDRLRRASAARIVRSTELAQSERDECIDRYQVSFGGAVVAPQ